MEVSQHLHRLFCIMLNNIKHFEIMCMYVLNHLSSCLKRVLTLGVSPPGPVLVITEYCSLGDLLNFLRQKAETFVNLVMNIPDIMENSNDYKNVCNQKQFIRRYITKKVLMKVDSLIKKNMTFLSIHLSVSFPIQQRQRDLQFIVKHILGNETQPAAKYGIIPR